MRLLLTGIVALLLVSPAQAQRALPNAAGVSFAHVHLNVADIEVRKKLWVEHFDGVVVQKGPLTKVKFPGMLVVLTERAPSGNSQGTVMDHFGFKVRNLAEVLTGWRAAGYEVQSEFTGAEGFDNAYLRAPDGVKFELQEDVTLSVRAEAYHVHFFMSEYVELMGWYVDMFSAVQRARGSHPTTADVPGINLSFSNSRTERAPTEGRAIDHIGFEVDNLEAFCETLEARGITFDVSDRYIESIELAIAFFTDPSGVRIELTEGFDEYKAQSLSRAPVRFRAHDISEIRGGYAVAMADFNNDGWLDVIANSLGVPEVAWHENPTWERHVIVAGKPSIVNQAMADLDDDGELELVNVPLIGPGSLAPTCMIRTGHRSSGTGKMVGGVTRSPTTYRASSTACGRSGGIRGAATRSSSRVSMALRSIVRRGQATR